MAHRDQRKQGVYFPGNMLQEIKREAARQDRTISWLLQKAWKLSRDEIRRPAQK